MSFTVEKLEHSMAKLTITVPAADFDKAMTAAYNKTKNRFNVPGFRKGKVPMAFIEKMYGPEVFYACIQREIYLQNRRICLTMTR